MKTSKSKLGLLRILLLFPAFLFFGCTSQHEKNDFKASEMMDSTSAGLTESKSPSGKLPQNRKFIRMAEMKFRTKNVRKSMYQIEDLVGKYNGFIIENHMKNEDGYKQITKISEDSLLEVSTLTTTADLNIRVPNQHLDSLLREMNRLIDFLDFRSVSAEDVSLKIVANDLKINRLDKNDERLQNSIDKRKGNVLNASEAENNVLDRQMQADVFKIRNMDLDDKIAYSTINLSIYEKEIIRKELTANPKSITNFQPNFFKRIYDSAKIGWSVIEEILVFLTRLWAVFLLAFVGYVAYKKYWK